tara:strand:+ start:568 stop:675 length:108 start_codon:yes stop_codon:yes gene_type:complete
MKNTVLIEKEIKPAEGIIQNADYKIQDKSSDAYDL